MSPPQSDNPFAGSEVAKLLDCGTPPNNNEIWLTSLEKCLARSLQKRPREAR